jgi:hypothetical protein
MADKKPPRPKGGDKVEDEDKPKRVWIVCGSNNDCSLDEAEGAKDWCTGRCTDDCTCAPIRVPQEYPKDQPPPKWKRFYEKRHTYTRIEYWYDCVCVRKEPDDGLL